MSDREDQAKTTPPALGCRRRHRCPRTWRRCCAGCGCRTSAPRPRGGRDRQGATVGTGRGPPGPVRRGGRRAGTVRAGDPPSSRRVPHREDLRRLEPEASSIPAPTQQALRTLEWVGRRENLVVCGPSGTGKTFLLEALGQHAVEAGLKVAWFTLEDLGVLLRRHRADDTVTKAIARVLRADLVVVDDIGLLPVAPDAAEGLYRLVDAAYEKRRSRSPRTCTRQRSTSSCPRPSPPRPSTGSCTTPTSARPPAKRAPDPSPRRSGGEPLELSNPAGGGQPPGQIPWPPPGNSRDRHRADSRPPLGSSYWPLTVVSVISSRKGVVCYARKTEACRR